MSIYGFIWMRNIYSNETERIRLYRDKRIPQKKRIRRGSGRFRILSESDLNDSQETHIPLNKRWILRWSEQWFERNRERQYVTRACRTCASYATHLDIWDILKRKLKHVSYWKKLFMVYFMTWKFLEFPNHKIYHGNNKLMNLRS